MKTRASILGLVAAVVLGLATTACAPSTTKGGDKASPSPAQAGAKETLAASVKELAKGDFTFTFKTRAANGSGVVHEPSKSAETKVVLLTGTDFGDMTMNTRVVGSDIWMQIDFSNPKVSKALNLPKKWLHIDKSKITAEGALDGLAIDFNSPDLVNVAGATYLISAIKTAQKAADGSFTGTINLTMVNDEDTIAEDLVTALGDQATDFPFKAALDAQNRLTAVTLDIPAVGAFKAHTIEVTFADYGSAKQVQKPTAAESVEAPDAVYTILNEE